MAARSPVFRRPLQPEDVSDTRKLYQHLSSRDRDITTHIQSIKNDLDTQRAARKLTSNDLAEISQHFRDPKNFSIDSLPGFALDPQNPNIPTLAVLPDPNVTLYTMVAVANAQSNSLYRLDESKVPKSWQKVGDLAGLASTGPGVVKQLTAGAALIVGPVDDTTLSANVALLNRDAQVFTGTYDQFVKIGVGQSPIPSGARLIVGAGGTGTQAEEFIIDAGSGAGGDSYLALSRNGNSSVFFGRGGAAGSFIAGSLVNDLNIRCDAHNINFSTTSASIQMLLDTSGNVGIGVTPTQLLHVRKGTGSGATPSTTFAQVAVENNGDGGIEILTPNANISRLFFSTPTSLAGGIIRWDQTNLTMSIGTGSAAGGKLALVTGNGVTALTIDTNKNIVIGTAALLTTATDGFLYIPTCAGPPTGVPTAQTGRVPMIFDSTNNNFYINSGGWKKVLLA